MGYIGSMDSQEKMTETIRVRVSKRMKDHLSVLAAQRGPGAKLSDLAREAIHKVYFTGPVAIDSHDEKPSKGASS